MSRIAIVGSGSWGTALALSLSRRNDHSIRLWSHSRRIAAEIASSRENRSYLPGHFLPETLTATGDFASALSGAEIVVSAVPSQHLRETYSAMAPFLIPGQILVSATKGIEAQSYLRMTEVIAQTLALQNIGRFQIGVLSGPSFAQEVAAGCPTAVTVAFTEPGSASLIQEQFTSPGLRLYTNDDPVGVELGGALKNVIAIAAGIATGMDLGHNSIAAIVTRGIVEITRLAVACGARRETLAGLAGLGDLVLTCTGPLSRNRAVGIALGRGEKLSEAVARLQGKVAEGVSTTSAALGLARSLSVEMPITEQMAEILDHDKPPRDAIRDLMARRGRDEG